MRLFVAATADAALVMLTRSATSSHQARQSRAAPAHHAVDTAVGDDASAGSLMAVQVAATVVPIQFK